MYICEKLFVSLLACSMTRKEFVFMAQPKKKSDGKQAETFAPIRRNERVTSFVEGRSFLVSDFISLMD